MFEWNANNIKLKIRWKSLHGDSHNGFWVTFFLIIHGAINWFGSCQMQVFLRKSKILCSVRIQTKQLIAQIIYWGNLSTSFRDYSMELLQDNIQNLMFWSLYSFSTCKWRTSFEYCKVWGISMAKVKICKLSDFSLFPFKWTCASHLLFCGGIWNNFIKLIS